MNTRFIIEIPCEVNGLRYVCDMPGLFPGHRQRTTRDFYNAKRFSSKEADIEVQYWYKGRKLEVPA